jgi:hypothetical protein
MFVCVAGRIGQFGDHITSTTQGLVVPKTGMDPLSDETVRL